MYFDSDESISDSGRTSDIYLNDASSTQPNIEMYLVFHL